MELFNKMWETFKEMGAIGSIAQYNAALRVQIENQQTVSPTDFLADLEAHQMLPNRVRKLSNTIHKVTY